MFQAYDKNGKPHRFDSRPDVERFLLGQGYSAIDAAYYAKNAPAAGARTDGAERVERNDGPKLNAKQRKDSREQAQSSARLGAQYFGGGEGK